MRLAPIHFMNLQNFNDQDFYPNRSTLYSWCRMPKLYRTKSKTLYQFGTMLKGKKVGNEMLNRMNNKNIPSTVRVYCKEIENHGEYS